jgi:hypothetical protein
MQFLVLKSYMNRRYIILTFETYYRGLFPANVGVPQSSALMPLLYLLYTADLPASPESTTAIFDNDTAVLATDSDPAIDSQKLQTHLKAVQK